MKKQLLLLSTTAMLAFGALTANAMDAQTLYNNPDKYRVVSIQPAGIVYVDMDSLRSMQTRDYPSSIENISATLYVEKYNPTITDMTFEQGQTVSQIDEYQAKVHGQKNENVYEIEPTLTASYTPDGKELDTKGTPSLFQNVKHMFISLSRLAFFNATK